MTQAAKPTLHPGAKGARRTRETRRHEHEARKAAQDARNGREVGALSATSAAAIGGTPGPGEPLGATSRRRLETAFGADLSGLRIHRGPAAQGLAERAGANAFAAGSALIFGAGAFRPTTGPGFELLAHETAHALQQAGTEGHDGRLHLVHRTPEPGAVVQRDPKKEEKPPAPPGLRQLKPGDNAWPTLKHIYATVTPFDPDNTYSTGANYQKSVAAMDKVIGGVLPAFTDSQASRDLAAWLPGNMPGPFRAKCLAFDALQISAQEDAAFDMLALNPKLETNFYVEALKKRVFGNFNSEFWAGQFLDRELSPYIKGHWETMQKRLLALALNPDTEIPSDTPLRDEITKLEGLEFGGDSLLLNPAQARTIVELGAVELATYSELRHVLADPNFVVQAGFGTEGLTAASPYVQMYLRALVLNSAINGNLSIQITPFLARLRAALSDPVRRAFESARIAVDFAKALVDSTLAGHMQTSYTDQLFGLPISLTKSAPFNTFLDGLAKLTALDAIDGVMALAPPAKAEATGANADDKTADKQPAAFRERMLSHGDFNSRRGAMLIQLTLLMQALDQSFLATDADTRTDDLNHPGPRSSLMILLLWSDWFVKWAAQRKAEFNPDDVALQRYHLGRALYSLGSVAGHTGLRDTAGQVALAKDAGRSYAIIPFSRFEIDPRSDYHKLPNEIPEIADVTGVISTRKGTEPVFSKLAIPSETLVDFYDLQYLIAVLPEISDEITRQQAIAESNAGLAQGAEREMPPPDTVVKLLKAVEESTPHPRRWISPDGVLVRNQKDSSPPIEVQDRHPATDAMLGIGSATGLPKGPAPAWKNQVLVRRTNDWSSVHYWVLPPLDPVRDRLRQIPEVSKIITAWKKDKNITEPGSAVDWLLQLYDWVQVNGDISRLRKAIKGHINKELEEKQKSFTAQLRKLTTVNRTIVLDYIKDRLSLTKDTTEEKSDRDIAYDPNIVRHISNAIFAFQRHVQPPEDRDIQTVALMIEAAPQILRVVSVRTGYQQVDAFFEPVALALAMATGSIVFGVTTVDDQKTLVDDPAAQAGLPKGEIKADFAGRMAGLGVDADELKTGIKNLREILVKLDESRRKSQSMFVLDASRSEGLNTDLAQKRLKAGTDEAQFVLALPYRSDVYETEGEGRWEPPERQLSPLEQVAGARQDVEEESAEPKTKEFWEYDQIVYTDHPIFYNIEEVYTDFRYMPAYKASGAARRGAELTDRNGNKIKDGTNLLKLSFSRIYKEDGETRFAPQRTVIIQAGDHQLLELMTNVVDYQARLVQLTQLAGLMEAGAELFLDLLEFVPGVGQAIMIARLGVNIAELVANLEWDEIKEDLVNGPYKTLELIQSGVIANLSGDAVWRFLLMQLLDPSKESKLIIEALAGALQRSKEKREKQKANKLMQSGPKRKSDKYIKFLGAVSAIGMKFAMAFIRATKRMEVGVNSAQGNIAGSPVLYKHLSRVQQYAIWAEMLSDIVAAAGQLADTNAPGEKQSAANERSSAQSDFGLAGMDFNKSIASLLAPLTEFELPEEVVPTDLLVEIIIDMTIGRIGKKNKKVRVVYEALRLTGGIELISREVSERLLKGSPLDPNKYWREDILPMVETPIITGRDDLVNMIYETLNALIPSAHLAPISPPTLQMGQTPFSLEDAPEAVEDIPDTAPFLRAGDPAHPDMAAFPEKEGAPLPDGLQSRLQSGFGHDLSHVRLHTDREADDFVRGAGAEALTTGSHIYLRDGLDPLHGEGCHILHHEVAHVLQQTGQRPLDSGAADRPQTGRPGRGVRLDPHREAAAERMARAARSRSAIDEGPLPVEGGGEIALAPFSKEDMIKMLYKLTRNAQPAAFAEQVASANTLTKGGVTAKKRATDLMAELRKKLMTSATRRSKSMHYGENAIGEIKTYVDGYLGGLDQSTIYRLASSAVVQLPEARQTARNKYELVSQSFLNVVEGYVFSKTGVRLTIDADNAHPNQVDSVAIRGLHLGAIVANTGLYKRIKNGYVAVDGLEFDRLRGYLRARFPLPHKWKKSDDLLLDPGDLKDIAAAMKKESTLDPKDLPPWKTYIDPKSSNKNALRVSTHGNLTGAGGGSERESHHLPQYLMVEFYAGANSNKSVSPFGRNGDYWTPGFKRGGTVETRRPRSSGAYVGFDSPDLKVDFNGLDPNGNRGDGMPAILLAAVTHQKGGLHLNQERAWDMANEYKAPVSQGFTMVNRHREFLIKAVRSQSALNKNDPTAGGSPETPTGFKSIVDEAIAGSDTQKDAIRNVGGQAIKSSYDLFVGRMRPPLERALIEHELPYYAGLAARHPDYDEAVHSNPYRAPDPNHTGWIGPLVKAIQDQNLTAYGAWYNGAAWK